MGTGCQQASQRCSQRGVLLYTSQGYFTGIEGVNDTDLYSNSLIGFATQKLCISVRQDARATGELATQ
jgi:hypothetical protein